MFYCLRFPHYKVAKERTRPLLRLEPNPVLLHHVLLLRCAYPQVPHEEYLCLQHPPSVQTQTPREETKNNGLAPLPL